MNSSINCDSSGDTSCTSFLQLPRAVQQHIAFLLPPNERGLTWRLVCRDSCNALSGELLPTASLSQPLPPHVVPWAVEAGQQHVRQLPFRHKLQLLCTAAASGSEVNLEVALALLQPIIFPEMLQARSSVWAEDYFDYPDPGVAAAAAGHPHLLRWLVHRCPGLVRPDRAMWVAAMKCNLAGLQETWDLLQNHPCSSSGSSAGGSGAGAVLDQMVLNAAAGSSTADAVAKMEWVLAAGGGGDCRLGRSTAEAAARSGDVGRLRWLRDRGCNVESVLVLLPAFEHADLVVAQSLVGEAGCALPAGNTGDLNHGHLVWGALLHHSVRSTDGVAKVLWLRERGCPPLLHSDDDSALLRLALEAAEAGRVEVVRYLHGDVGQGRLVQRHAKRFGEAAAASGSIPMAQFLHQEGAVFSSRVFSTGRTYGKVEMIRWLTSEAGVSIAGLANLHVLIRDWPDGKAAHSRDLLEAVQLLVGVGSSMWAADAREGAQAVHAAAKRGDLALVQYLLQGLPHLGCRLDAKVLESAAEGGCEALVEWLVMRHTGCCLEGAHSYMPAAEAGDRGTLTALRRLGVPWGAGFTVALAVQKGCPVPVLRWLVEQGAPVGSQQEMECALNGVYSDDDSWEEDWDGPRYDEQVEVWLWGMVADAAKAGEP